MTEAFFSARQQEDFSTWVAEVQSEGRPYWKVTDHASAFEHGWLYGREYGFELSEDALDAANAKLARISVALVAPPSAEEAMRLIRKVLNDD